MYLQHLSLRLFVFKNIQYKNLIKLADHLNQQSLIVYLLCMAESMEAWRIQMGDVRVIESFF